MLVNGKLLGAEIISSKQLLQYYLQNGFTTIYSFIYYA